MTVWSSI